MPSVKAILPRTIDARALERTIMKEKAAKGRDMKRELEKTTKTWTGDKPRFKDKVKDRGDDTIIIVDPEGNEHAIEKWSWLNEGVPPHPIRPKNPWGKLFFGRTDLGGSYVPKTRPGELVSGPGMDAEDNPLHAPGDVIHPGIKARKWIEILTEVMKKTFGKRMATLLRKKIGGTYKKAL